VGASSTVSRGRVAVGLHGCYVGAQAGQKEREQLAVVEDRVGIPLYRRRTSAMNASSGRACMYASRLGRRGGRRPDTKRFAGAASPARCMYRAISNAIDAPRLCPKSAKGTVKYRRMPSAATSTSLEQVGKRWLAQAGLATGGAHGAHLYVRWQRGWPRAIDRGAHTGPREAKQPQPRQRDRLRTKNPSSGH
jgi:hypothetical protein